MALDRLANGTQRPNVTCSNPSTGISPHAAAAALLNGASSGISVFNPNCFADPGDQQLGNAPRYFSEFELAGNRECGSRPEEGVHAFGRTMKLQIRMEAFNAFNRTRFDRAGFQFGSRAALAR